MYRDDPDMDPGGIEFQGFGIEGQNREKPGDVRFGKGIPSPEPVRNVRGMKSAQAGPIENRPIGKINQNPGERRKFGRVQSVSDQVIENTTKTTFRNTLSKSRIFCKRMMIRGYSG